MLPSHILEKIILYLDSIYVSHALIALNSMNLNESSIWKEISLRTIGNIDLSECNNPQAIDWKKQFWIWKKNKMNWKELQYDMNRDDHLPHGYFIHRTTVTKEGIAWLFGGQDSSSLYNEVWRVDLRNTTLKWELVFSTGTEERIERNEIGIIHRIGRMIGALRTQNEFQLVPTDESNPVISPVPRTAASWVHKPGTNFIYLFGGCSYSSIFLNDLWRWDTENYTWSLMENQAHSEVPSERWGHTAVAYGESIYLFGGSAPGECFSEFWKMDDIEGEAKWSRLRISHGPSARSGHSCSIHNGFLYIFGGNTISESFNDFWRINLNSFDRWEQLISSPGRWLEPRVGHQSIVMGNRIFILFGRCPVEDTYAKNIGYYDIAKDEYVNLNKVTRKQGSGYSAVLWDRKIFVFGGSPPHKHKNFNLLLLDMSDMYDQTPPLN